MPREIFGSINDETTEILSDVASALPNGQHRRQQHTLEFSPRELESLINKLEDIVDVIKSRSGFEQPSSPRRNSCFMKIWAWIVRYFLAVTTAWQIACIALLTTIEVIRRSKEKELTNSLELSTIILTLCQGVLIFVVICMSIKITKQYFHMTLTPGFLFQAYLSSILVFTGLYTLFVRISDKSFRHVGEHENGVLVFEVYVKMLFFSVSTATLCGVSLTYPNVWYAYITVAIQMLLSFLYFASILSVVIDRRKVKHRERNERTALINRYGTAGENTADDQV